MATFISLLNFTDQDIRNIKELAVYLWRHSEQVGKSSA